jgi:hypothetical protein
MTTKRYEDDNYQITYGIKDDILSLHVLDHIGCLMFSNDFSNDCLVFGKLVSTKGIYDILAKFYDNDADCDDINVTYTYKSSHLIVDIEHDTGTITLPISLTLNQHEISKESFDKLELNRHIHKLEKKYDELNRHIHKMEKKYDELYDEFYKLGDVPCFRFNNEHLFVPRNIACLYLGEISIQYHMESNFLADSTIKPTIVDRSISDITNQPNAVRKMSSRFPADCSNNCLVITTDMGSYGRSLHIGGDIIISPLWDLDYLDCLPDLEYLAIDCLTVKTKDFFPKIPYSIKYLYLIDPQFDTIPDLKRFDDLKKLVIHGRSKSLVKKGMTNIVNYKSKHPDFEFEKLGDQVNIEM